MLRELAVSCHEIGTNETVAVEKYDVFAGRLANGMVADFRGAKAMMLMPDMGNRNAEPRLPLRDHRSGRRRRAIVRYDDLEVSVLLCRERAKHDVKRVFAIIGGHDDGDQRVHRVRPLSQAFM